MNEHAQNKKTEQEDISLELSVEIVSAYVSNNAIASTDLPNLIKEIHSTVAGLSAPKEEPEAFPRPDKPAVSIKKSLQEEYLICLEDGLKFKSLKRHLRSKFDLSPDEYRTRWGLPSDYPMVAPAYARRRSELAKNIGLGQSRTKGK